MHKLLFIVIVLFGISIVEFAYMELYPARYQSKWGYIDEKGNTVIEYQWEYAGEYRGQGYAVVSLGYHQDGIIDLNQDWVLPPVYSIIEGSEGMLCGGDEPCIYWFYSDDADAFGFFNTENGFYSETKYGMIVLHPNNSRLLLVKNQKNKAGYIDKITGETCIPFQYDPQMCSEFWQGYALVKSVDDDEFFFIDENNHKYYAPYGFEFPAWAKVCDGRVPIFSSETGYYHFSNLSGEIMIMYPMKNISNFSEGICAVEMNNKTYAIDTNGSILFQLPGDGYYPFEFHNGYAVVDGCMLIDTSGDVIVQLENEHCYIDDMQNNQYACIYINGFIGFITNQGKTIWSPENRCTWDPYSDIYVFNHDIIFPNDLQVLQNSEGEYGYIDVHGNTIIDFQYSYASQFYSELALVEKEHCLMYIDKYGNTVWPK